jgi:hypothetical protein
MTKLCRALFLKNLQKLLSTCTHDMKAISQFFAPVALSQSTFVDQMRIHCRDRLPRF